MNQEKLTITSVSNFLGQNLNPFYNERELNSIIRIILRFISGRDNTFIHTNPDYEIPSYNWFKVNKICADLKNMVPVQYITGETEFYGIKFTVTPDTLIPRQETEELVDLVIKENRDSRSSILDIGTGTGCIAISLALNLEGVHVTATDISTGALDIASKNSKMNSAGVSFIMDDILDPDISKYGYYDIVVCNPPYITESEKADIERNVLDYEPHPALFVPDDNALKYYRAVLELCKKILKSGGSLYFEINEKKGQEITGLLMEYGYHEIELIKDLNGKARITKSVKG